MEIFDTLILIIFLLTYSICKQAIPECQLTLTTHKNCKQSIGIIKIFEKLKSKYEVSNGVEQNKDKATNQQKIDNENNHIDVSNGKDSKNSKQINQHTISSTPHAKIRVNINIFNQMSIENQVTYPYIWLKVNTEENRYEGELSFVQIQYYLQLKCFKIVPPCASWMSPPIYPINIPPPAQKQSYHQFLDFLLDNSPLKTCLNTSLPYPYTSLPNSRYSPITSTITQLMHSLPLFPEFTHNIRSYLLNNEQRTLIIYFYNNKNAKQKQIKQKFVQLIQYIRVKDRRIGYHIGDQAREKLLFICQKIQGGGGVGGSAIVQKLMGFIGFGDVVGKVVGIRFTGGKGKKVLESVLYNRQNKPVFDNKFIFWLQQVSMTPPTTPYSPKLSNHNPITCPNNKQNKLLYFIQQNNIKQTLEYLSLLSMLQKIQQKKQDKNDYDYKQQEQEQEEEQEQKDDKYGRLIFDVVRKIYRGFDIQQYKEEVNNGIKDQFVQIRSRRLAVQDRIQQILGNQTYRLYKWQIQIKGLQSIKVLYLQLPPIVLCLVGEQPIRFKDHQELLQHSLKNRLISFKNSQQKSNKQKIDPEQL